MKEQSRVFFDMLGRERNVYELAELFPQNRRTVDSFLDMLRDPETGCCLKMEGNYLIGDRKYEVIDNVPRFASGYEESEEWHRMNKRFLKHHSSLSTYTLLNSSPIMQYVALETGLGLIRDKRVLDAGGGTGHSYASFFHYPESIDYYLLDPNIRLLHDQFIRLYPKLLSLKMGHVLANAEQLPFKDNCFDVVLCLSAIDHMDDYSQFIKDSFRVLDSEGELLVFGHLDRPLLNDGSPRILSKLFSRTIWEKLLRHAYLKLNGGSGDAHTLHLHDEVPIEKSMLEHGFTIRAKEVFHRYFYIVGKKR